MTGGRGARPERKFANGLGGLVFRANPSYELVLLDRLSPAEQAQIRLVDPARDLYGAFRPQAGSGLEWRAASRDTALLFFSMLTPGPLPEYVRANDSAAVDLAVARLTLDGVLEVHDGGRFVSGAQARQVWRKSGGLAASRHTPSRSIDALRYGQALGDLPPGELAQRLYFYGQQPLSPAWRRRLPDEAAVRKFLALEDGGPVTRAIAARWTETLDGGAASYWRMWRPRRGGTARTGAGYKLYVSPDPSKLRAALPAVVETLTDARGVRGFKIGRDLYGIYRPDKVVAYFSRLDEVHAAAERLQRDLDGMPAHGVPFTAEITRDGLLSWGIDPPPDPRFAGATARGSWRFWVADRLAEYLCAARVGGEDATEPWEFALDRLAVDGVDPHTWVPASHLWQVPPSRD